MNDTLTDIIITTPLIDKSYVMERNQHTSFIFKHTAGLIFKDLYKMNIFKLYLDAVNNNTFQKQYVEYINGMAVYIDIYKDKIELSMLKDFDYNEYHIKLTIPINTYIAKTAYILLKISEQIDPSLFNITYVGNNQNYPVKINIIEDLNA